MESNLGMYIGLGLVLIIVPFFNPKWNLPGKEKVSYRWELVSHFAKIYLQAFFGLVLAADTVFRFTSSYLDSSIDIEHFKLSAYWLALVFAFSATIAYSRKRAEGANISDASGFPDSGRRRD